MVDTVTLSFSSLAYPSDNLLLTFVVVCKLVFVMNIPETNRDC